MTQKDLFLKYMAERRRVARGSAEWTWRTRACRQYVWMHRGVPVNEWVAQ